MKGAKAEQSCMEKKGGERKKEKRNKRRREETPEESERRKGRERISDEVDRPLFSWLP